MTDTLVSYGSDFQAKTLAVLMSDGAFVAQIWDLVQPTYFETDASRWIVQVILDYFNQYRKCPTVDVFKVEHSKLTSEGMKASVTMQLKKVIEHLNASDLGYVKDQFLRFCRYQKFLIALTQCVSLQESRDYDKMQEIMNEAARAGISRDFGHDIKKDIDKRLRADPRHTTPTPWLVINGIIGGGLAPGELGVVMAPTGAGKSWFLAAIGLRAVKNGKKVLHVTLELNDTYTGKRYDSLLTGITFDQIEANYDRVANEWDQQPGELVIKSFPNGTINTNRLCAHLQQMEITGWKADLLIVDYADLMLSNGISDNRYEQLGNTYGELRSLAGELGIPCWTATQTQRGAYTDEVITADKIAESFQKVMIADFVMALGRSPEDKAHNKGRVHINKNRMGNDGMTFPARINYEKGEINIDDAQQPSSQSPQKPSSNGNGNGSSDMMRRLLHDKYQAQTKNTNLG